MIVSAKDFREVCRRMLSGELKQEEVDLLLGRSGPGNERVEAEREAIMTALRKFKGDREKAADALGLSATTLWRKMHRLNIQT